MIKFIVIFVLQVNCKKVNLKDKKEIGEGGSIIIYKNLNF